MSAHRESEEGFTTWEGEVQTSEIEIDNVSLSAHAEISGWKRQQSFAS